MLGTYQLFAAAARAGVRRVIFSSSLYAYGRMTAPPMREDEPGLPVTVYGTSKLAGERFLHALAAKGGPTFTSLRYFFAYGPGPSRQSEYRSVVTVTVDRLLNGGRAVVHGDGLQELDYVYVGDIVEATVRALSAEVTGEVLNVCTGNGARVTTCSLRSSGPPAVKANRSTRHRPTRLTGPVASATRADARMCLASGR